MYKDFNQKCIRGEESSHTGSLLVKRNILCSNHIGTLQSSRVFKSSSEFYRRLKIQFSQVDFSDRRSTLGARAIIDWALLKVLEQEKLDNGQNGTANCADIFRQKKKNSQFFSTSNNFLIHL